MRMKNERRNLSSKNRRIIISEVANKLKNSMGLVQGTLKDNLNKCYNSCQIHVLPAEQWAGESNQHMPGLSRKAKKRTRTQEIVISVEEPINYFHTQKKQAKFSEM